MASTTIKNKQIKFFKKSLDLQIVYTHLTSLTLITINAEEVNEERKVQKSFNGQWKTYLQSIERLEGLQGGTSGKESVCQ